ncbi:hypothetical protein [Methanocalculus natronophilus]|uniref:hypothetical protein n=1 Tax=Methanocalculus natronophilus TaxID=1262400 RepID=UPI0031B5A762
MTDFKKVGYARLCHRAACVYLSDEPDHFFVIRREDLAQVIDRKGAALVYRIDEEMTESPQKAGFMRLSKSGKALVFKLKGFQDWFTVPAKAMISVLGGNRKTAPVSLPASGEADRQVTLKGVRS